MPIPSSSSEPSIPRKPRTDARALDQIAGGKDRSNGGQRNDISGADVRGTANNRIGWWPVPVRDSQRDKYSAWGWGLMAKDLSDRTPLKAGPRFIESTSRPAMVSRSASSAGDSDIYIIS